jgi:hypothetical protein
MQSLAQAGAPGHKNLAPVIQNATGGQGVSGRSLPGQWKTFEGGGQRQPEMAAASWPRQDAAARG